MLIYLDINVKVVVILARGMTRQWHHTVIQVLTIQHVLIGGITSKVSIGKTSSPDGYSTDEFYVGTTSDPKLMGSNTSYTVAWPVNNPVNRYEKNWDYSVNSLYHNNVYVPSNDAATAFKARYTTTHEIGHSLGLDHTTGTNAQNSLMKGSFTGSETSHSPTTYDKNQLKSLYGN